MMKSMLFFRVFSNAPQNSSKLKLVVLGSLSVLLLEVSPLQNHIFVLLQYQIFLTVTKWQISGSFLIKMN
jgi:hypothetical protein